LSADSPKKQKKFVDKFSFPYPMLCDESTEVLQAYEAFGRKKFMGREYDGIFRVAYLIDEAGVIEQVMDKVKTKSFAADVLGSLG